MIHRLWLGPQRTPMEPWLGQVVRNVNVGAQVNDWTWTSLPRACQATVEKLRDRARPQDRWRHDANVARWWLLREFGGAWLDHDLIPFVASARLPLFASAHHGHQRCNCYLAIPRGHPMCDEALDAIEAAPASQTARSTDVSGEGQLQRLAPRDMLRLELPFGPAGHVLGTAAPWAVHTYASASAYHPPQ